MQSFLVEFSDARLAVGAHGARHFGFGDEGFLAAHADVGFLCEFHEAAEGRGGDGDGAGVFSGEELGGFFFAEDGVEDAAEGFGELVVEVVFGVDGDVVFEHEDGVFGAFVVFGAAAAFDDDIGDAVAERGCGAEVALFHAFHEFDVRLFAGVVLFFFGEGFGDDEFGHVDFVLEEVGDGGFDIATDMSAYYSYWTGDSTYSCAPWTSWSINIFRKIVSMTFCTSRQLSLRTVSIPLLSILSYFAGVVQYKPAYRFLLIKRYGK